MSYILKTNTATRIAVGPLVDPGDGKTAETSLTVTGLSMQLYQIKNDGGAVVRTQVTPSASGGDNDMALVASSTDGMYDLELTAAQLNWLGNGRITFYDVDGFLVHWIDIQVVSAAYFDWIYGTTIPNVNTTQISGDETAADNAEKFFDGTGYAGTNNVIPTVTTLTTKTGFALSADGADLILKSSTFIQAIVAAINELATYGLTALNTLLVTTGIKTATTAAPADMAKDSTVAKEATLGTVAGYLDTEIASILEDTGTTLPATLASILEDTGTTLPAALTTIDNEIAVIDGIVDDILVDTGTTLPATLAAMTSAISGGAAAVWNYLTTALTTAGSIGKWFADWFAETPAGATSLGASDLVLVNNALTLLGHDTLTALTGTDKVTTLCLQFYQRTVDNVLRAYTWNCAMTRSAALTAGTTPAFGYAYSFALPSGCLRVIRMSEKEYEFKVEGANLLTDESSAQILYIARIAPTAMDTLLIEAISARLASLLAFPLTNSNKVAEDMWKMYLAKLDEAQNIDAFEGTADSLEADDWLNTRG